MTTQDQFAVEITRLILEAADESIQLEVLNQMTQDSNADLEGQLEEARIATKRAGDFGMEIIGPIIIPVLIEAGKSLWKLYVKKLGEKVVDKVVDYSLEKVKDVVKAIWHHKEKYPTTADYETELKKVAVAEGLAATQIEHLIEAIRKVKYKDI